ncbi:MAG: group II intron reverse transcriptase/maturase [Holosporales bacterium]|jgi:group II intron reverse transcriptase/maturase|nr:group II intron reverse transcriptase/maturase [Holosporales bacterium]
MSSLIEKHVDELGRFVAKHRDRKVRYLIRKINEVTLCEIHRSMPGKKSAGLDRISKQEYGMNLRKNVRFLLQRIRSDSYYPKPLKRVYIPKHGNRLRPLGIMCYEDKVVASNITKLLSAIYEQKFMPFSYGFRQNRNCHDAILKLRAIIMGRSVNYIVEADIKSFFDTINHGWLIGFLERDIADKKFIRLITRFLNVGTVENGRRTDAHLGTPQGNTISSTLANIYLHYVLDLWFKQTVQKRCRGKALIVRYADDFVCAFASESDAKSFMKTLTCRLQKFGLSVAREKTKMISLRKRTSFSFLGFTFLCDRRSVALLTDANMLSEKIENFKMVLRNNRNLQLRQLITRVNSVLIGHYNYYGISTNMKALVKFRRVVGTLLSATLKARGIHNLKRYQSLLAVPKARIWVW